MILNQAGLTVGEQLEQLEKGGIIAVVYVL